MDSQSNRVISVGADVPDFTMETYEPSSGSFGKFALAEQKTQGKWTVLVFYPADFTFVCPTELADLAVHQVRPPGVAQFREAARRGEVYHGRRSHRPRQPDVRSI
jgi:hypothetical protein